ncbi:Hypothetical predicted protein [Podarcis lilfordi]|uniref:Uncharacterized protein n=1 Tax=Podarcis lilfordi TaxID=74358 RepID=A0AA35PEW6_9SAUR|nr:Hypothetical predicted protein [Podarcis lilfordi]
MLLEFNSHLLDCWAILARADGSHSSWKAAGLPPPFSPSQLEKLDDFPPTRSLPFLESPYPQHIQPTLVETCMGCTLNVQCRFALRLCEIDLPGCRRAKKLGAEFCILKISGITASIRKHQRCESF